MQRPQVALLLGAMVVLAGCSGGLGPGGSPNSPTPTSGSSPVVSPASTSAPGDSPTAAASPTPTPTPTPAGRFPPGTAASGIENTSKLVLAGRAVLANTSYRFRTKAVRIAEDGSKSVSSYRGVAGPTGRLASSRFTDPGETNRTIWDGAGPGLFVRKSGHDGTRYVRAARGSLVAGMYDTYIRDVYSLMVYALSRDFHWEPVDRFTRGGQVFVVFETTGVNRSGDETTGFTAGNMTMTVREDGLVTSIRGAGKRADDGGSRRYRIRFEVTDVGTATTSRPDWVDSRIPNVSARLIMNGSVVKVTHHGGPTIRKAMLRLELGYRDELVSQVGNVTSGETVYVYRNADGLLVVERTRPSPAETSGTFESASSVTVKLVGEDVSVGVVAYWTERA